MKKYLALFLFAAIVSPAVAADNFYPDDNWTSPDLYVHFRSIEEYRQIVPVEADRYGMCRQSKHLDQCLWKLNGHPFPPTKEFSDFIKKLEAATKK